MDRWTFLEGDLWAAVPPVAFALVLLWEALRPSRPSQLPERRRWTCNLGLFFANSVALTLVGSWLAAILVLPRTAWLEKAIAAASADATLRFVLLAAVSILVLDLTGYLLHRLFHAVPVLWRFHEVHHSDRTLDGTTGVRHHIVEVGAILAALQSVGLLLGVPEPIFAVYGVALGIAQFFQHGNIALPPRLERTFAAVIVTPQMHAVHHAEDPSVGNRNYGTVFNFWDRLFQTFDRGHPANVLTFGVQGLDAGCAQDPWQLLLRPFRRPRRAPGEPLSNRPPIATARRLRSAAPADRGG